MVHRLYNSGNKRLLLEEKLSPKVTDEVLTRKSISAFKFQFKHLENPPIATIGNQRRLRLSKASLLFYCVFVLLLLGVVLVLPLFDSRLTKGFTPSPIIWGSSPFQFVILRYSI